MERARRNSGTDVVGHRNSGPHKALLIASTQLDGATAANGGDADFTWTPDTPGTHTLYEEMIGTDPSEGQSPDNADQRPPQPPDPAHQHQRPTRFPCSAPRPPVVEEPANRDRQPSNPNPYLRVHRRRRRARRPIPLESARSNSAAPEISRDDGYRSGPRGRGARSRRGPWSAAAGANGSIAERAAGDYRRRGAPARPRAPCSPRPKSPTNSRAVSSLRATRDYGQAELNTACATDSRPANPKRPTPPPAPSPSAAWFGSEAGTPRRHESMTFHPRRSCPPFRQKQDQPARRASRRRTRLDTRPGSPPAVGQLLARFRLTPADASGESDHPDTTTGATATPREGSRRCGVADDRFDRDAGSRPVIASTTERDCASVLCLRSAGK